MAQIPHLNGANPAPPSGYQNARWQQGPSEGNDPTYGVPIIPDSCYVPNAGTAVVKTASYTATIADMGTLLVFNSASALTLTLPNPVPLNALTPPTTETRWNISVQNLGAGVLTISRNGLLIDTLASNLTLSQNQGLAILTDGTNYFTERGLATDTSGLATKSGVQQEAYTYAADTGSANAYAVALTPAPTLVAGSAGSFKAANACTGPSTLAINGGAPIAIKKNGNSTALASGDIAANQIIDWTYDGTVIQILVPGSGGGGSSLFFGNASAIAINGNNVITLGSTPVAGSVKVMLNGVQLPLANLSVSGAVVTYAGAWTAGDVITSQWTTANSTPGGITLSSTIAPPRGTGSAQAAPGDSSMSLAWPTGTIAGDRAIICAGAVDTINTPSGWTVNNNVGAAFWNGAVLSRVLTSGDITAGSVTIALSIGGGAYRGGVATITTFIGAPAIREVDYVLQNATTPVTVSTSGAVLTTDTALYFGSMYTGGGASTDTVNRGTLQQSVSNGGGGSACLYTEFISAAGVNSAIFSYSAGTSYNYQAIVVVATTVGAASTTPEIAQSQVVGLPAALAAKVSSLNALTGALSIVAGSGVTVTPSGSNITIAATGGGGGGTSGMFGPILNVPTLSALAMSTAYNQQASLVVQNVATGVQLYDPNNVGFNTDHIEGILGPWPGTAFTVTALFSGNPWQGANCSWGICIAASPTGNVILFGPANSSTTGFNYYTEVCNFNTPTSYNSRPYSGVTLGRLDYLWIRLQYDGTNLKFYQSFDGVNWVQDYSVTLASSFVPSPAYLGIFIDPQSQPVGVTLMSYKITTP
jgi:hypothetical protein